ncbi:MAG: hypothetical protein A3F40_03490 [Chlamydiae bacterium RIFCSPHIGHO2_12_FULL_27_8]|nr:MAG: hypothetical protein A3F40_03490 [Chlamydiae bacterium RIFCSPHIGHO2_12_FULL_27_8]OGN66623.1 MAG: hypothetical protein A2888_02470 [Chlamydiae bacterium RIFCSPLOWO2_01_FULL_28_7]
MSSISSVSIRDSKFLTVYDFLAQAERTKRESFHEISFDQIIFAILEIVNLFQKNEKMIDSSYFNQNIERLFYEACEYNSTSNVKSFVHFAMMIFDKFSAFLSIEHKMEFLDVVFNKIKKFSFSESKDTAMYFFIERLLEKDFGDLATRVFFIMNISLNKIKCSFDLCDYLSVKNEFNTALDLMQEILDQIDGNLELQNQFQENINTKMQEIQGLKLQYMQEKKIRFLSDKLEGVRF